MIEQWLEQRSRGEEQRQEDIAGFVRGVVEGSIRRLRLALGWPSSSPAA